MARYYFGAGSPLGRHLTFERDAVPYEIVGVVGDATYEDLHETPPRTVYLNAFQEGRIQSRFALRTDVTPTAVAPQVRRAIDEVLKTVRVGKVTTLSDQVDSSLVLERVVATLSGLFGALGACLAAIGLYGLLAYTVTTRTNEIGVRMALGATSGDVTRMVLKGCDHDRDRVAGRLPTRAARRSCPARDGTTAFVGGHSQAIGGQRSPVMSRSRSKNAFFLGLLMPQLTGTLWYPSSKPSFAMRKSK